MICNHLPNFDSVTGFEFVESYWHCCHPQRDVDYRWPGRTYVRTYVRKYVRMYVRTYVRTYVRISVRLPFWRSRRCLHFLHGKRGSATICNQNQHARPKTGHSSNNFGSKQATRETNNYNRSKQTLQHVPY